MKKFDTDQMIFTIVLTMLILGIIIYRTLHLL